MLPSIAGGSFSVRILLASGVSRGAVSCLHIVGLRVVKVDLERACSVARPFVVRVQCLRDASAGGGEVSDCWALGVVNGY